MQRVLSVSLSHVIRSAAFLLLPFSFIALIAWATAGSASGNTSDPIRGALWIWLGAHHIPFQLSLPPTGLAGYLTYLPIGGVLLPFFAIRSAFNRAIDKLKGDFHDINSVRLSFAIIYAALATLLAFVSGSATVQPQWYLAPVITFFIAFLSTLTAGGRISLARESAVAVRILSIILGVSLLVVAILIIIDFTQVKNLTISLEPGIFGAFLLLALNIAYLPNAAIAVAGYFSGTGIAVGAGTIVSPLWHSLGQIPALPLLGILPTTRAPLALFGIFAFIAVGVLLALWSAQDGVNALVNSYLLIVAGIALLGYLASGSLITTEMGAMGVSIWKFTLAAAIEIALGALLTTFTLTRSNR